MSAITVTRANFEQAVLQASATRPVLVDFWAPWCAPCRALAPVLERLADELPDGFTLAKINTEDEPELAARFGVRSIPNCKLFVGGAVVDEFTGALPESALRAFLARALPSPAAAQVAAAKARLAAGEAAGALAELDRAEVLAPDDEDAQLTRIEALIALDRAAEAGVIVARLDGQRHPVRDERRFAALKARAALAGEGKADLATLARKAAAMPVDCAAKLAYAKVLASAGDYERALAELLSIVQADRKFDDDAGRRTMLSVFDVLPGDSELARRYRRALSAAIN